MHDEAVTASSTPEITSRRYLPYESAYLYGHTEVADGGYYLAELTLERRLVRDPTSNDPHRALRNYLAAEHGAPRHGGGRVLLR